MDVIHPYPAYYMCTVFNLFSETRKKKKSLFAHWLFYIEVFPITYNASFQLVILK